MNFKTLCQQLEEVIVSAYTESVTVEEAEKHAARFLHAQMTVSNALRTKDLDARMRKSGLKAVRAAVYTEEVSKHEKKPVEAQLAAVLDTNELVASAQDDLDTAEVDRDELERYYDIFHNAHLYFRGIAKTGSFNG